MNKIFVSAGLVAIGVAGLQSAIADSPISPKYWNVGATLRGFYDDNYAISSNKKGSFGVELLPTVSFHVPLQQTDMGIRYTYGLYYYENRDEQGVNAFDQTHQLDLWLDHAFNERWHGKINDTFSVGQEPELLNPNPVMAMATPYRVNGDNFANHGSVALSTDWTRLFSTVLTYDNNLYDYNNHGTMLLGGPGGFRLFNPGSGLGGPSLAGVLNRIEESVSLDLKWHLQRDTTVFVGYQLSWVNFTGNEPIAIVPFTTPTFNGVYHSSDRDNLTHYGYLGLEHQFTPNLSAMVRGGASYTDSYADPLSASTSWAPYADVSLSYTYIPGSYVQFGFTHDISATDQVQPDAAGHLTQYAECSVIYVDVNHRFTQKLVGTVIGRVQYSTYQGGRASSADETDYGLGLNLNYQINQHLSVDAGYNYDNLETALTGYGYTRNRVYLGLTANY
jgi:Putative beta-barrel porin 2